MKDYIRLATIDNFQGEEAKVIILSTVRSGGRLGFVKSANRINVACSRARDGFYVVGSANNLESDPKWRSIISIFNSYHSIGQHIRLQCGRHSEYHILAKSAHDITSFALCSIPCSQRLSCGHLCMQLCHDPTVHAIMSCQHPCTKDLACGHSCRGTCVNACGPCQEKVSHLLSTCRHTIIGPCSAKTIVCDHPACTRRLSCGKHSAQYTCGNSMKGETCGAACDELMPCGHHCDGVCGTCHKEEKHPKCAQTCDKLLSCGHECKAVCHKDNDCLPCEQPAVCVCPHQETKRKCTDARVMCLVSIPATGPDGETHDITCCLTKQSERSSATRYLQHREQIMPLIPEILQVFADQVDTLQARILHRETILSRTIHLFLMQTIQPSTTAAANTITSILRRTDERSLLQTDINTDQNLRATFDFSLHIISR